MFSAGASHLRVREGHEHHRVTFVELFFDLVFVFAVTQLSHRLLDHLTPLGVLQTAMLMVAFWWVWVDTTWVTNWLDPEKPPVRTMLFSLMLAGLVMSASIPKAFEERGLAFALALAFMQIARTQFVLWALRRHDRRNYLNFRRIAIWRTVGAAIWVIGAFTDGGTRLAIWSAALAIDSIAPAVYFRVPGLGASTTEDWNVEGVHMAERCGLFVIIALGESILVTGATFAGLTWSPAHVGAFLVAFTGSVAMWAIYFNVGAERTSKKIAKSDDPGRIARSGYTYLHILIVSGIIVTAVGDELVLHHSDGHTELSTAAAILGGPALYLAGNALFKRLSASRLPLSHLVGLGLLALLVPVAPFVSPLILASGATLVLILVPVWEWRSLRHTADVPAPSDNLERE
ncbi:MAG: low temperature requirement protein A [Xanthobacteraceae bacterium]